jgi:hypothetical protein
MSTPAPGRKMSTADLAAPDARIETGEGPEVQPDLEVQRPGPLVAGPEARRAATDDAGEAMPRIDAARVDPRIERRGDVPPKDQTPDDQEASALFADDECHALWKRWDDIQAGFVDEPRQAVQEADSLVAETMQQLANTFARERNNLEQQWGRGGDVSTEDLRIAFRRYRSFFKRLLSV